MQIIVMVSLRGFEKKMMPFSWGIIFIPSFVLIWNYQNNVLVLR